MENPVCIAIDGPAGAGKSTVARMVAEKLGYVYIDTGAMYRAVTLKALMDKISMNDEAALTAIAENIDLTLTVDDQGNTLIYLGGSNVTKEIRQPDVSKNVSLVSRVPGVREHLSQLQKSLGDKGGVVMEGRDIGTHVLPGAEFKFYLTASVEERARRRCDELRASGYQFSYENVVKDIQQRDEIDMNRATSPLKPARDAVLIDCSAMAIERVVDLILTTVSRRSS